MATVNPTAAPANVYVLKGFGAHSLFVNNQQGVTNPIGELSAIAKTYSREIGEYFSAAHPDITLNTFLTKQGGEFVLPDSDLKERVIKIIDWVYNNTLTTSGELFADQIVMQLIQAFPDDIRDLLSGTMANDGSHWAPTWLSWYDKPTDAFVRIWFSDTSFRHTYDEFEIAISGPMDNIDDFFKTGGEVQTLLTNINISQTLQKAAIVRDSKPETYMRADLFDYHDPINAARIVPSPWIVLVYGEAGNNIDSIKDALQKYILTNSTHTRDEWVRILPDIFRRTEFTMVPDWSNYAIPERITQAGIYSPINTLVNAQQLVDQYAPSYNAYHRSNHSTTFDFPYKSLNIFACSSEENRDDKFLLSDYFPDYIAVSTSSQDFNRMSEKTRAFSELVSNMVLVAESMDRYSDIPAGMTRLVRDDILYVVANYDNVHYLVTAKSNMV